MTKFKLGINTGFATNRFPEPEVWLRIVGKDLGLRCVQFVADLLNPMPQLSRAAATGSSHHVT